MTPCGEKMRELRTARGLPLKDMAAVLVITGKGTTKETGGVIRARMPKWLNQAPTRARILAFAHAQPQHGGLGALYVLLRRTARAIGGDGAAMARIADWSARSFRSRYKRYNRWHRNRGGCDGG